MLYRNIDFFFPKDKGDCVNSLAITPSLIAEANDPETLYLYFDHSLPEAINKSIEAICKIHITNFTGNYSSRITINPKDALSFIIDMDYSSKFKEGPFFDLSLVLSNWLKQIDTFYFTNTRFTAKLSAYYSLDSGSKKLLEGSANATKQGAEAAQSFLMIQNVLNAGSSVAMKSLMLMEIIRLLRFINVK
jgi:hypothetical protein